MRYRDKKVRTVALSMWIAVSFSAFAQEEDVRNRVTRPEPIARGERTVKRPRTREGVTGMRGGRRGQLPPYVAERFDSDNMRDLVEVAKVWRMGRELELSEEQTLKLLRVNDEHRRNTARLRQQQTRLINDLRRSLPGKKENSKQIQGLLKRIESVDEQRLRSELDRQKKLLEDMSVQQKAKYYIFRTRFDKDMRGIIEQIMRRRRQDRPGARRGERNEHDRGDRDVPRLDPSHR